MIILLILSGGGVCVFLAFRVYQINDVVDRENSHALSLEQIHSAFDHLISEFQDMAVTDRSENVRGIAVLQADLTRRLETFRQIHGGEWDSAKDNREQAAFAKLQEIAGEIGVLTNQVTTGPFPSRRPSVSDLDRLRLISREVAGRVGELRDIHRAQIARILQGSQATTRLIVLLYLILVLLGGSLVAVATVVFRRRIVAPLRLLAGAALGIAEDRLEARVPVHSSDEIGQLSHAFNIMAGRLEDRERDLRVAQEQLEQKVRETQALYRIGTEISELHGLDRILRSVVEKSRELLKGDAALLCMCAQGDGLARMAAGEPPDAFTAGPCPAPCRSLSGEESGALNGPCLLIHPEYLQASVAAQVRRGGRTIGVIHVCRRNPEAFTPVEAELLDGLATQAAIAIENARLYTDGQNLAMLRERERIAREMHDGLAQGLGLLNMKISRAQELAAAGSPAQSADRLSEMKSIAKHLYDELRQSIFDLRTMVSQRPGLIPRLTKYIHEFSDHTGIPVELKADDAEPFHLSPASEVQLIRIIQEALANVRKHARAERAWVRIQRQGLWIELTIEDNGCGCAPEKLGTPDRHHFGLQTMRERAEGLGGTLEIDAAPSRGVRVVVTMPQEA